MSSVMWTHFLHLLGRALSTMPSHVSSNWAAVIMAVGIFVISQLFNLYFRGWDTMKRQWKGSIAIGVAAVAVGWFGLCAWSIVATVYSDHQNLVAKTGDLLVKNKQFMSEGSRLVDPTGRDAEIAQLKQRAQELQGQLKLATRKPPPECWWNNHYQYPNPYASSVARSATAVLIFCNYKIEAPWAVQVEFDRDDFFNESVVVPGVMIGGITKKEGKTYIGGLSLPSVPAYEVISITVETNARDGINAVKVTTPAPSKGSKG